MKKQSGVYLIHIPGSDKIYIGSGISVSNRASYHRWKLNRGIHDNKHLQRSFNKHQYFVGIFPLEYCDNYAEREQYWIDLLKPEFNMRKVAESNAGMKFVAQWKREKNRKFKTKEEYNDFLAKHLAEFQEERIAGVIKASNKKVLRIIGDQVFEFESIKQAAFVTGKSRSTIYNWIYRKNIKKSYSEIWKFG